MGLAPKPSLRSSHWSAFDARLIPVAAGVWCGTATGIRNAWVVAVIVAAACLLASLVTHHRCARRVLGAAVGSLGIAYGCGAFSAHALASSIPASWAQDQAVISAEIIVTTEPRIWRADAGVVDVLIVAARSGDQHWRGRAPAHLEVDPGDYAHQVGERVAVQALARPAAPGRKVVAALKPYSPLETVRQPKTVDRFATTLRLGLRSAMRASPDDQAGLVLSMVVGDTEMLPAHVVDDFQKTGLTHLTAVSGTNLTLMLMVCLGAASWSGMRGWPLRFLGVAVTAFFVLVCRSEPSVLRAAAMGVVSLGATGFASDHRRALRYLCVAVIVLLLCNPWLSGAWAFILSVSACAGILVWAPPWREQMSRWAPASLADAFVVPLAAQIATQPMVTFISGNISLVGVLANVVAGPFIGIVTVLGLAAGVVSLVSLPAATFLGWIAGCCVQPIILGASIGADVPSAVVSWPATPAGVTVVALVSILLGACAIEPVLRRGWATLCLVALMIGVLIVPHPTPGWMRDWAVIACDVGQGSAQLYRTGEHSAIVVDAGPDPQALRDCLALGGVRETPMVVITHGHADHIDGLEGARLRGVQTVLTSTNEVASQIVGLQPDWASLVRIAVAGEQIRVGDVEWTTVASGAVVPGSSPPWDESSENDSSVSAIVSIGQLRIVTAGDVEEAGQARLTRELNGQPADVLIVPHHGSKKHAPEMFHRLDPSIAIIQCGQDNDFGHPSAATLATLASTGAQVFRNDEQGSIAISADGTQVVTQR